MPARDGTVGLDWAVADREADAGSALTHGRRGWLRLVTTDGEIPSTPRLQRSADLTRWRDVTPPGDVLRCGDGGAIAASGSTYLVRCGGLWRSTDARSWKRLSGRTDDGTRLRDLKHLISDGRSFIAWRGEYPADDGIWSSVDGTSWRKVHLPGASAVKVDAVIGRPDGGYVLAGRVAGSAAELTEDHDMRWWSLPGDQAVWQSDDGLTWKALGGMEAFAGARITDLAADGPGGGFVAAGQVGARTDDGGEPVPAVWRSADGISWQRLVGPTFALTQTDLGAIRVVATPDRWLIFASRVDDRTPEDDPMGVAAGSEDGRSWWSAGPSLLDRRAAFYSLGDVVVAGRMLAVQGAAYLDPGPGRARIEETRTWVSPP